MKKSDKGLLFGLGAIIALFLVIGWAGEYDYAEQVILHMSCDEYEWSKDTLTRKLGEKPTQREIAHWWAEHHGEMN